jgi:hypothetical protein
MAHRGEYKAYFSIANSLHFRYSLFGITESGVGGETLKGLQPETSF